MSQVFFYYVAIGAVVTFLTVWRLRETAHHPLP